MEYTSKYISSGALITINLYLDTSATVYKNLA